MIISLITFYSCKHDKKYVATKTNEFNSKIEFEKDKYNFGVILPMDTISTMFKFKNKGDKPLTIRYVKSSCGCVISEWPMNLIEPNESGEVKVVYDAKYPGRFNKTVTVFYNGKDSPKELTIKGEVHTLKN